MSPQQRKEFLAGLQGLVGMLQADIGQSEQGLCVAGMDAQFSGTASAVQSVDHSGSGINPQLRLADCICESLEDPREFLYALREGGMPNQYQGLQVLISRVAEQLHCLNGDLNNLTGLLKPVLQLPPQTAQSGGSVATDLPPMVSDVVSCLAHVIELRSDIAVIAAALKL